VVEERSAWGRSAIIRPGVLEPDTVFIQKPFTPAALGSKIRETLDPRRLSPASAATPA
jgi:hypothetical protein